MTVLVIHKFVLNPLDPVVMVPAGNPALTAAAQGNNICVWIEVDPMTVERPRRFHVVPTGGRVPAGRYVGTAMLEGGALVFHVYEATP